MSDHTSPGQQRPGRLCMRPPAGLPVVIVNPPQDLLLSKRRQVQQVPHATLLHQQLMKRCAARQTTVARSQSVVDQVPSLVGNIAEAMRRADLVEK